MQSMSNTPYFTEFLTLASLHLLAVIAPGADFAITVRQSVRQGRWAGLATALGIGAALSVHVAYTLLGLAALLHSVAWLQHIAQLLGAGYLLYLGIGLLRSQPPLADTAALPAAPQANAPAGAASALRQSNLAAFRQGFLTNATNPKATLFFMAVFTTVVHSSTPLWVQAAYGAWMCAITSLWFTLVALMFSHPAVQQRFLAIGYWFERAMGALLVLLALRLGYWTIT